MKDFNVLVDIWQAQNTTPAVNYKTVIASLKKTKGKFKRNITLGLIAMLLGIFFMLSFWLNTQFMYTTTHVSIAIFVCCCLYFVYTQILNLKLLSYTSYLESPQVHLNQILAFKKLRFKQNNKNYFFYSIAIGVGLALYFIEFFANVNNTVIFVSIAFTVIWFALTYLYLQKVYLIKEEKLFSEIINDLERIKSQFKD